MTAPAIVKKPDASALFVCIEPHTSATGTYTTGDRLRGDHPDVKRVPAFWVPDGTSTDEVHEAHQERFVKPIEEGTATT